MKIFVTGSNGFIGSHIVKQLLGEDHQVFASSRNGDLSSFNEYKNYRFIQVDFTDPYSLHDAFEFVQPGVVVHCGAISKPDYCELKQAEAFDVNVFGTVQLLLNAEAHKSFFIQLSSDFIFNGATGMHKEEDAPNPISYYGKTKVQAEEAVQEYQHGWSIVRTSFVYGKPLYGRDDFVTMISKKINRGEVFNIVNDQKRTPTYAPDLAKAIATIIKKRATGIYHISGNDILTPYEISIFVAKKLNITNHFLTPVTRANFKEIAQRPLNGSLNIDKAARELDYQPTRFEDGLKFTLS